MRKILPQFLALSAITSTCFFVAPVRAKKPASDPLLSLANFEIVNVKAEAATYRGRPAIHLLQSTSDPGTGNPEKESLAILKNSDFHDGTIEADLAATPRAGAPPDARGFVGIAFRTQPHGLPLECFYLRQTNGRSDDQLRRNHSAQYISSPAFPWERLRKETPGVYESYVDLEPGAWTKVKIVVAGTKAKLYVNDSAQPCLIVNDLKLGDTRGQVALWIAVDTDAYFSNLSVK
jgi:hypothetical protein